MRIDTRGRFLAAYSLAFALLAIAVFIPFLIGNHSFIWDNDGFTQHVKALGYYGMWLRDIGDSLVAGNPQAPTFAFSLGYGSDIIGTLNYYAIGDPLNLLAFFVPLEATPVLYNVLVIVRFYLIGLSFALFARYAFKPSGLGLLVGALIFAFCGFSLFAGVRHPFFLNPLIYFPFVLYGVEKVLRERKHAWFAIAIALCAVSNFYFFYMIFFLMAIYIVMRLVALHRGKGRSGWKHALSDFARLVASGLVGLLVSCILFLPVVLYFLQDTRAEVEHAVPLLYGAKYYAGLLMDFPTMESPGKWTYITTGVIGVMGVFSLFAERRKNTQLKVALIIGVILLCIPVFGYALNGFSYLANRWSWAISFVVACIIVVRWRDLVSMPKRQAVAMAVFVAAYLLICLVLNWIALSSMVYAAMAGVWLILAGIMIFASARDGRAKSQRSSITSRLVFAIGIFCGIVANAFVLYLPLGANYADDFVTTDRMASIYDTEAALIDGLAGNEEFYRYSGPRGLIQRNAGASVGVSSTANFWSLVNASTKQFFHEMGVTGSDFGGFNWYDLNGQTMLDELVGVKYYAARADDLLPFGYNPVPAATGSLVGATGSKAIDYGVFVNEMPLSFGYSYVSQIASEEFAGMEPYERREALMQGCLIDENTPAGQSYPAASASFTSQLVPYAIKLGEGIEGQASEDGASIEVKEKGAKLSISADGPASTEESLQFAGFSCDPDSDNDCTGIKATFRYADGSKHTSILHVGDPSGASYEPYSWHTVGPGYSESPLEMVTLTFPNTGTYSWESLVVIAQPMTAYTGYANALLEDTLENVDLHYLSDETAATNRVTGTISLDQPKILCTQIPYSEGWGVTVDGEKAEVLKANIMFVGVALDAGEHVIEFTYETPGLFVGTVLTIVGIVLVILIAVIDRRRLGAPRGQATPTSR